MKKILTMIIVLYLVTWLPSVFIIRQARSVHSPMVYPILPFIVLSCDESPSLAGEWSIYLSYVFGVKEIWQIRMWIE